MALTDEERFEIKNRLQQAAKDRRKLEPVWYEALAFAKGYQWVRWVGQHNRALVTLPNPKGIERYTVDELTQYRLTILGELSLEDERPQVLFRQGETPEEDYAQQANDALAYGWDEEWRGDEALLQARMAAIDLGTAPVRCRFDPDAGPVVQQLPYQDGKPVWDRQQQASLVDGAYAQGQKLDIRPVRQGRICWDAGTPFNSLVPAGFPREDGFPWEAWISVEPVAELKARYGAAAAELRPDTIRSVATLGQPHDTTPDPSQPDTVSGQVKDHCFLYTYYERPSRKHPDGCVVLLASATYLELETRETLPYRGPDGQPRSGIHYLHAVRLSDRFWSRGFVELGISPQRAINKRKTQIARIIDSGLPMRRIEEGAVKKIPEGFPGEILWLKPGKPQPITDPGVSPGAWMYQDVEASREDLARAVLPEIALGENPNNVQTYSQLALLKETAGRRLDAIVKQQKQTISRLAEDSLYDIKRYWGPERQIQIAGDDGQLRAFTFNATQLPDYMRVEFARGATKPRSQAAQLQLINDVWQASVVAKAVALDPAAWIAWYKGSLEAGKMLDLPGPPVDVQRQKAVYENHLLLEAGFTPQQAVGLVDYYDQHELHIVQHREVQTHARLMGRNDVFVVCEAHIKEHERQAILNQIQQMQSQPPSAVPPGGPPPAGGNGGGPAPAAPVPA